MAEVSGTRNAASAASSAPLVYVYEGTDGGSADFSIVDSAGNVDSYSAVLSGEFVATIQINPNTTSADGIWTSTDTLTITADPNDPSTAPPPPAPITESHSATIAGTTSELNSLFANDGVSGNLLAGITTTLDTISGGGSVAGDGFTIGDSFAGTLVGQPFAPPTVVFPAEPGAQLAGSLSAAIGKEGVTETVAPAVQYLLGNYGKSIFSAPPSSLPESVTGFDRFLGDEVHGNAVPWTDAGSATTVSVLGNLIASATLFYDFYQSGMAAYQNGLSATQAEQADVKAVEAAGTFLTGEIIVNGAIAADIEPLAEAAGVVVGAEATPSVATAGILGLVGFAIVHVGNYLVNGQPDQMVDGVDIYGPQSILSQGESEFGGPAVSQASAAAAAPTVSFGNSMSAYGSQVPQASWSYDADNGTFAWLDSSTTDALAQSASQMGVTEDAEPLAITGGSGDLITGGPDGDLLTGAGDDEIIAGPGSNVIDGGGSGNFLEGGTGQNTMTGGGGDNIFAFVPGDGLNRITDFSVTDGDQIDLAAFPNFHSFTQLAPDISQSGSGTLITLGPNESIKLDEIQPTSLTAAQFIFAPLPEDLSQTGVSDLLMTDNTSGALVLDQVAGGPESYQRIGGLGSVWQFEGSGSFLGDGNQGELLWDNESGAIVVAEDHAGTAQYTAIGGVGSQWQFEGNGPILGQSTDDFLIWNNVSGAIAVGAVSGNAAQYTAIGGVGANWQFEGVGDFLGDGNTGFLLENSSSGAVVVGEDLKGAAQYTAVSGLGSQWQFEGTGDLLGDGEADYLIRNNSSGALVVGELVNGAAQYTQVGAVGPEWQFLGVGNYDGANNSEFVMRDGNSGTLVVGSIANGAASYAAVGGVGPEWNFHAGSPALLA